MKKLIDIIWEADGFDIDNLLYECWEENDPNIYIFKHFSEFGEEYRIEFTEEALNNAEILNPEIGLIMAEDMEGHKVQIKILKGVNLSELYKPNRNL